MLAKRPEEEKHTPSKPTSLTLQASDVSLRSCSPVPLAVKDEEAGCAPRHECSHSSLDSASDEDSVDEELERIAELQLERTSWAMGAGVPRRFMQHRTHSPTVMPPPG